MIQAGGEKFHAGDCGEGDECNDQSILDQVLTLFFSK